MFGVLVYSQPDQFERLRVGRGDIDLPRTELASEIQQLARKNLILKQCRDTKTAIAANKLKRKSVAVPVRFKIEDRHRVICTAMPPK